MSKTILTFDNIITEKHTFHRSNHPIDINSINIEKLVVSNKFSYDKNGFKYFIGLKFSEAIML